MEKDLFLGEEGPSQACTILTALRVAQHQTVPGKEVLDPRASCGELGVSQSHVGHGLPGWVSLTSKQKVGTEHRVGCGSTQRKPQIQEEVELRRKYVKVI